MMTEQRPVWKFRDFRFRCDTKFDDRGLFWNSLATFTRRADSVILLYFVASDAWCESTVILLHVSLAVCFLNGSLLAKYNDLTS